MATVDYLAKKLSERTGTTFMVMRARLPLDAMAPDKSPPMRYGLRAMRGDVSYRFQGTRPLTLGELTRWLASINDMVNMGFIPIKED